MKLAERSVHRFIFRYLVESESAADLDLERFLDRSAERVSQSARETLRQARERYRRYESLVERVMKRASRSRKFQTPTRDADAEEVVLREVMTAVAHRNPEIGWSFRGDGLAELTDDFLLLWQYLSCYDHGRLRAECLRWAPFLIEGARPEDTIQSQRVVDRAKPVLRPVWMFFVALCHTLQQGEQNELTALDACRFGLVDEVMGTPELASLRLLVERAPD